MTLSPRNAQRGRLLASLAVLMALLAAFAGGYYAASLAGVRAAEVEVPAADPTDERVVALGQELQIARTQSEVDREALELVRREIARQKEYIAGLEEGLGFYKSLMSPEDIAQGLSLRGIELVAGDRPGRFAFRIVAQQEARKHSTLKGELTAQVHGLLQGEQISYPLADLAEDMDGESVTLRFRYFQAIEGVLNLPPGFEPSGISVIARAKTPRTAEVRADYQWRVQERFTHVGK